MMSCWDEEPNKRPSFHQLKLLFGHLYTGELNEKHDESTVSH